MTEKEIMNDFDGDKYIDKFCMKMCKCSGTDYNGENDCFGCEELDKRIDRMYQSILKRRSKKLGDSCV